MLESKLKDIGLTDREAKIYLVLLESGAATAASLAKEAGENRTTVYSVLSGLMRKSLISMDVQGTVTYYIAENPESIADIFAKQKEQIDQKFATAKEIAEELQATYKASRLYSPKTKTFVGKAGIRNMFTQYYDIWMKDIASSSPDKVGWGYRKGKYSSLDWQAWLSKEARHSLSKRLGIKIRVLTYADEKNPGLETIREVKKIPKDYGFFDGVLWLCGDFIAMFYDEADPPFGVMIRDHALAQTLRSMFYFMWDQIPSKYILTEKK